MSNKIDKNEVKKVNYEKVKYYFTETNVETGESYSGYFTEEPMSARLMRIASYTILILEDGSKGVAECGRNENFSRKSGLKIAWLRAMIIHFQKELDRLCSE
jgi:hypothetical protein